MVLNHHAPPHSKDTIATVSTPGGSSQRAIVRMSGAEAGRIISEVLSPLSRTSRLDDTYRAVPVVVQLDALALPATLYIMRAPRSYTREDVVEIHTFGAPPLVAALMDRLIAGGARAAGPGEFTRRAFLNGRVDLAQAEAVQAIVRARDETEYRAAHNALSGRLSRSITELHRNLTDLAAMVEVSLDFSDQDVEIICFAEVRRRLKPMRLALSELLGAHDNERISSYAVRAVLFGPPNVGKSSLFNAIVQRHKAIVSPEPGTTRDTIEAALLINGIRILLVDTAGLRPPADAVEAIAVARSQDTMRFADLNLCVLDASTSPDDDAINSLHAASPDRTLVLLNKCDAGAHQAQYAELVPPGVESIAVSALAGSGIARVLQALCDRVRHGHVDRGPGALMVSARQTGLLRQAAEALGRVLEADADTPNREDSMALAANDINDALHVLGDITGASVTEDVLDRIFESFCIGK